VQANVIRNFGVECWLFSLRGLVPKHINTLEGLLRDLNPKADVVGLFSVRNRNRKEGSYEEPRSIKHAEIQIFLNTCFALFGRKRGDDVWSSIGQFKVFVRML
jgi:hypothetical protein